MSKFIFIYWKNYERERCRWTFEAMKTYIVKRKLCTWCPWVFWRRLRHKIENTKRGWLKYHGYQSDIRPFVERAHCFVLPSWHEGMANTNLESAASGRPIITSDIPGCKEAVIESKSGYLCERKIVVVSIIRWINF